MMVMRNVRKMGCLLAVLFVVAFLIPVCASGTTTTQSGTTTTQEQEQEISLTKVSGLVEVQTIGEVKWKKAVVGMKLKSNQRIRTFEKSRAYLDLGDGSSMVIGVNSILDILELKKQIEGQKGLVSKVKLWIGKIRTEIKKLDADSSFEVITPTALAGVRGTKWSNFVNDDDSSSTYVEDGTVWLESLMSNQKYMVLQNQFSNVTPTGEMSMPAYVTQEQQKEFDAQWKEDVEPAKETSAKEKAVKEEKKKKEESKKPETPAPAPKEESGKKGLTCEGLVGSRMIDGKNYNEIILQPDISFGKLGIGLNILARWNEDGFRKKDYDDAGNIIRYVRWAEKGDKPFYVRLGTLDGATLGHGFILDRYSNQGTDTSKNILGSEIDVNLKNKGIETVVNNITDARLFGVRLYCQPLKMMGMDIPVLSRIDLGLTGVTDTEPQKGNKEAIIAYGVDLGMPIFGNLLKLHADMASIQDFGQGTAYGLCGRGHVGWINTDMGYKLEMRNLGEKFVPSMFNSLYEVRRPGTASLSTKKSTGWYTEATIGILKAINMGFSMQSFKEGEPTVHGELSVDSGLISRIVRKNIGVSFSYDQVREKGESLFQLNAKNSVTTSEIIYGLNDNVLLTYIYRGIIDKNGVKTKTASLATKMAF
ncbi:FecR domain-containing protein [Candidatus Desantisbacteria bacterium]|nr:FecR domain-containing protein [Candidatus Desantisbacteria bacterium]